MTVIRVDDVEKSYGTVQAVDGMDFAVERGELFGFLGPNGAGKTTTIRALTGQIRPDSGTISVLGTDPTDDPLETRSRVGILPEQGSPPSFLTPREYLEFVGIVRDLDPELVAERTELWADRLGFRNKLETLHTDLSRGQQQKVMIAQAFVHEPEVVLIDEPLANLDPLVQEQVKRFLLEYAADDNAVFVSTHNIGVAESICSRVGIVVDGEIVAERPLEDGVDDGSLLDVFLAHVDEAGARDLPAADRVHP
ncbi:ABC transporter ATP-binding protein [Natrialba sp. INN-245]|uniref:ABC transporter ATP-binding protein n=1 Tax=Natrialba sp. INN-245 TaxID=2690967 RepID=UPI0013138B3F|nr:ABC transporter ATP-binding protein [Natrialba sp. INN-245]MWV41069.1 ATP-binding cassette domain-containing protein [Natrialba sp. INN-245]